MKAKNEMLKDELQQAEILIPLMTVLSRISVYNPNHTDGALNQLREIYSEFPREGEVECIEQLIKVLKKFEEITS